MISSEVIKELAVRNQTIEINIAREYLQNLFLSYFYQKKGSDHILFKGGTALRLIYQSPRYSEDMDFTGVGIRATDIKKSIRETLDDIKREGIDVAIQESKSTSGGYLCILVSRFGEWNVRIFLEVSFRPRKKSDKETVLITNPFLPSYTLFSLSEDQIVEEKISALIGRKRARDFFDIYFIIRNGISRKIVALYREQILKQVGGIENKSIKRELRVFLPRSYWPILSNLKENLKRELERV